MKMKNYSGENMAQDSSGIEGVRIIGASPADSSDDSGEVVLPASNTENVELPHWSEAPTGEVQIIGAAQGQDDAAIGEGWDALTGSQPRLRVDSSHWKENDYDPDLSLNDDSLNVGALGSDHISFTESDDDFEKNVAEKRANPIGTPTAAPATDDMSITGQTPAVKKISTIPDSAKSMPITDVFEGADDDIAPLNEKKTKGQRKNRSDITGETPKVKSEDAQVTEGEFAVLIQRTVSALVLAGAGALCMFLGAVPTLIFVTLLIGFMTIELCSAFKTIGSKPAVILVAAMSMFSVVAGYLIGDRAIAISVAVFFAATGLWYLLGVQKARPVVGMAISALVFMYVGILGSFAGMILALKDGDGKSVGVSVLVAIVICVAANDTTAYLAGKYFGRTPIAPKISPNKTMEGTTAGVVASLLVSVFIASSLNGIFEGVPAAVLLGFAAAACAFTGDLVESMLKRDCKLKDFGSILPGHGGLMDRFDGLLFALPAIYYIALAIR